MTKYFHSMVFLLLMTVFFAITPRALAYEPVVPGPLRNERIKAKQYIELAKTRYGVGTELYMASFRKLEEAVEKGLPENKVKIRLDNLNQSVYQQMVRARKAKIEASQSRPGLTKDGPMTNIESILINYINEERKKRGLNTLRRSITLVGMAREHSRDMARGQYFSHKDGNRRNAFGRAQDKGLNISVFENIAKIPTNARGRNRAEMAHKALMRSPGHKANILNPKFVSCGVGCTIGKNSVLLVTQLFSMDNI